MEHCYTTKFRTSIQKISPQGNQGQLPVAAGLTKFSGGGGRKVAALIIASVMALPGLARACTNNQPYANAESEGTHIFTAANSGVPFGGLVPFTGGYELNCGPSATTSVSGSAVALGGGTTGVTLQASASYGPAAVHSQSSSSVGGALAGRNTTPAIFADAASVLKFNVSSPLPPTETFVARLRFDLVAEGSYYGSGIPGTGEVGGSAGFAFDARAGAAGPPSKIFDYRDSSGVHISNTVNSFQWNGPPRTATLNMTYDAGFYSGDNWLQMDLYTFAWGAAAANFGSTGRIVGVTVLTPGAGLELPAGLFTADPNQSGHFILTSLLAPVPEPASWMLMLSGLMVCLWRRQKMAA